MRCRDDTVVAHSSLDGREVLGLGLVHQCVVRPGPLNGRRDQSEERPRRSRILRSLRARGVALWWACNKKRRGQCARQQSTPADLFRMQRAIERGCRGQHAQHGTKRLNTPVENLLSGRAAGGSGRAYSCGCRRSASVEARKKEAILTISDRFGRGTGSSSTRPRLKKACLQVYSDPW